MFKILLSRNVEKFLDNIYEINPKQFKYFIRSFDKLAKNPFSAKTLMGNLKGYYSYRVGDYRIIFEIDKKKSSIYIEKIAHRRQVYK
jgi:mRNA interferase RelE/StbE